MQAESDEMRSDASTPPRTTKDQTKPNLARARYAFSATLFKHSYGGDVAVTVDKWVWLRLASI